MQITATQSPATLLRAPGLAAPEPPKAGEVPFDRFEFAESLVASATYGFNKVKAKWLRDLTGGLGDQPKVKLERPLVCIQGFRSKPGGFKPLLEHLTSDGLNGRSAYYVKNGNFFLDPGCQQRVEVPDPDTKVFRVLPNDRLQSWQTTADQLKVEFDAIKALCGPTKMDILAHSMGGLSVRAYLDKYDDQVGKLLMVGTPHRGTRNAEFARQILAHNVGWAMQIGGLTQFAAPAVELMRSVDEEPEANPALQALNSRWETQKAKTEGALTIGSSCFLTPGYANRTGWGQGDALVETSALQIEGMETKVLPGRGTKVHHTLPTDDEVFGEMTKFFGWAST